MAKRHIRLTLAAGLVALAAAGCGSAEDDGPSSSSGSSDSTKSVRVAFFNPVAANAVAAAFQAASEDQAEAMGATFTAFDAGFDQKKQMSQMQDAIASGQYDVFVVPPVNGAVLVDVTKQAIAAGIKVVAVWNNIGPDMASMEPQVEGITSVVGTSFKTLGTALGEQTVKGCEGIDPCTVIYMPGSFKQGSEQYRLDAVKAVTDKHPNIQLKTSAEGGYTAGPAQAAAADVLLAMPKIDVFVSVADQMTIGIVQAIKDAGKLGSIKIVSSGATKEGIQLVRDGVIWSNTAFLPYTEASVATKLGIEAAQGMQVAKSVDSSTLSPIGFLVTKEALETPEGLKFTGEYSG